MIKALAKFNPYKLVIYDIETVRNFKKLPKDTAHPCYQAWAYSRRKHGEYTYKQLNTSYKDVACLNPEFSKVVCISAATIQSDRTLSLHSSANRDNEFELLSEFNDYLANFDGFTLAGFSINGFDTPFLCKRNIINGLEPSPKLDLGECKPWERNTFDLYDIWRMNSYRSASQTELCYALEIPTSKSSEIDGSKVGDVYYRYEATPGENLKVISDYCDLDVITFAKIVKKLFKLNQQSDDNRSSSDGDSPTCTSPPLLQHN